MRHINEFCKFAADIGLAFTSQPIDDGEIHRFTPKDDKPHSKNGWYVLYDGRLPAGVVGSWKTGEQHNWCSKAASTMSSSERFEVERTRLKAKAKAKAKAAFEELILEHQGSTFIVDARKQFRKLRGDELN